MEGGQPLCSQTAHLGPDSQGSYRALGGAVNKVMCFQAILSLKPFEVAGKFSAMYMKCQGPHSVDKTVEDNTSFFEVIIF